MGISLGRTQSDVSSERDDPLTSELRSRIGPVDVGAVIDPEDHNALLPLVYLIEDPVRTPPGRPDSCQFAT
jgi:hypothetical protein